MLLSLDLFKTSVRGGRIGVLRWLQCHMVLVVIQSLSQSVNKSVSHSDSQSGQSVSQSVSSGSLYALVMALHLPLCKSQDNCSSYVIANYSGALLR